MHSHTGCIYLAFLHCVLLNATSNHLTGKIYNHTGSIDVSFLHCVFSNGSSNGLSEKMHSHIGCICLAFLQCVFSNGFSVCLPGKMHNHTGCNWLIFPFCYVLFLELLLRLRFYLILLDFDPLPPGDNCCSWCNTCFKLRKMKIGRREIESHD